MEWLKLFLESQPLFALFATIALGYVLGEVSIKGFSLGTGAVLFVGLAVGALAPKSAPPGLLGSLGLLLFLYGVGLGYGKEFFRGLTSPQGIKANIAALCGVLGAMGMTLLLMRWQGLDLGHALGMFAGSGTSTPTLQAAMQSLGNDNAAVGYSVAYPFGVAGPILFLFFLQKILKPKVSAPEGKRIMTREAILQRQELFGQSYPALAAYLSSAVDVVAVRRQHRNFLPDEGLILEQGDIVLLAGVDAEALETALAAIGSETKGQLASDRSDLEYYRVFVSKRAVTGIPLGSLQMPFAFEHRIAHVRRGDVDLLARPDLTLELGDRVGILAPPRTKLDVGNFFGDSIKGTADLNYVTVGLGAAIGLLLGLIPIPVPGLGSVALGMAGVLLFALILGRYRVLAGRNWMLPLSANIIFRNFGLTIFLAQVGMASGNKFMATISGSTGLSFFLTGVLILLTLVLVTFVLAYFVFRLPFDEAAGIVCGATGNPAILAFASRQLPTDKPDIGYAMIFPSMTVLKIVLVEIVALLF